MGREGIGLIMVFEGFGALLIFIAIITIIVWGVCQIIARVFKFIPCVTSGTCSSLEYAHECHAKYDISRLKSVQIKLDMA